MLNLSRMPLSEKKLAANRANAAKSTGPKTAEGKRNTSRNATRHGILANTILIDGESRERFAALLNSCVLQFQPETPVEHSLVERIAVAQWRQTRIWSVEAAGLNREIRQQSDAALTADPPTRTLLAFRSLAGDTRHLYLMSRYEHRYDRMQYRAIEALERMQERRIARAEQTHGALETKGPAQ